MSDPFSSFSKGLTAPGSRHFAVAPDDGADLAVVPRSLWIGGAGDVVLRDADGTEVIYTVAAGTVLPFRPVRVLSTGTTATQIVGWY